MSGPVFTNAGARSASASAATITPALPSGGASTGMLLAIVTSWSNAVHSTATPGWSLISQVNSGASFTASLWCAAGNAAQPTFTWTGAVAASAVILNYNDPSGVMHVGVGASTSNTGATSPHSTSSITTTQNNARVVYVDVSAANTALSTPTGYTSNLSLGSATDAGHTDSGSQSVPASGSPSTAISTAGAAASWVEWQVELYSTTAFMTNRVSTGAVVALQPASLWTNRVSMGAVVWSTSGYMMTNRVAIGVVVGPSSLPTTRRRQSGLIN